MNCSPFRSLHLKLVGSRWVVPIILIQAVPKSAQPFLRPTSKHVHLEGSGVYYIMETERCHFRSRGYPGLPTIHFFSFLFLHVWLSYGYPVQHDEFLVKSNTSVDMAQLHFQKYDTILINDSCLSSLFFIKLYFLFKEIVMVGEKRVIW